MESLSEEQVFRLRRNLSDAGCDPALISRFLELEQCHRRSEQYRMLARQRRLCSRPSTVWSTKSTVSITCST